MRCCRRWVVRRGSTWRWILSQHGVLEKYGVEMIGANADVIDKAESRDRFQDGDGEDRPGVCRGETVHNDRRSPRWLVEHRACRPWCGRASRWAAAARRSPTTDDEFDDLVRRGLDLSPIHAGADRRIDHRLERVRDGGDARQGRQRRDHLLDRELRSDGRSHGRLDHGRARADA